MRRIGLFWTLTFLSTSVPAAAGTYAEVGGWTIYRNTGRCAVSATYESDTIAHLSYDFGLNNAVISISDPKFKSIEEDKKYPLKIVFMINGNLDDGWGVADFLGVVFDDGTKSLSARFNGRDFIADFSKATTIALFRDDVIVESLNLSGTGPAVAKLIECAKLEYKTNPSDPLVGAGK